VRFSSKFDETMKFTGMKWGVAFGQSQAFTRLGEDETCKLSNIANKELAVLPTARLRRRSDCLRLSMLATVFDLVARLRITYPFLPVKVARSGNYALRESTKCPRQ